MDIKRYIKECYNAAVEKGFYDCPVCKGYGSEDLYNNKTEEMETQDCKNGI